MSSEVYVAPAGSIADGGRRVISTGERTIGVFRLDGRYYAYENRCVHQGGPVCYGQVLGKVEAVLGPDKDVLAEAFSESETHVVCPWHGYEYDLRTGECVPDRRLHLRRHEVVERDGSIYVLV